MIEKIEKVLLILFLLLIPTQLGMHFWPEWSYVVGMRIDYLSPTLYLVDLVWIGLFGLSNLSSYKVYKAKKYLNFKNIVLFLFIGLNIYFAKNHWVAGYVWLRIFQIIWMVGYLRKVSRHIGLLLHWVIPCWIVFESLLGLGQVINGGSLNGIFYWFGERRFDFNTIGIAQWSLFGHGLVRAYGTFSHPNSLAGFLLVSLLIWKQIKIKRDLFNVLKLVVLCFGVMGIVLSGSRVVWLLGILSLVFFMRKFKAIVLIGLIIIGFFAYKNDWVNGWDKRGLERRMDLNISAIKMIKDNPLFGIGAGNFLVRLPEYQRLGGIFWLQPVHNIPLLIASQIGIIGVFILISGYKFLIPKKIFKSKNRTVLLIWGIVLVTGMFDHYWITLPQNWWLLGIVLIL